MCSASRIDGPAIGGPCPLTASCGSSAASARTDCAAAVKSGV